jgi:hypothetical protein
MAAGDVSVSMTSQAFRPTPFNDGTVSGGVTISDGDMVFDGVNGKVTTTLTDNSAFNTTGFSLTGWFNATNTNTATAQYLNTKVDADLSKGFYLYIGSAMGANRLNFKIETAGVEINTGASSITGGNLYHYVVNVEPNGNVTFYLNGIQSGTPGISGTLDKITTTTALILGNRVDSARPYGGTLSSVVFNRPLSQTEISQIYNAGKDAYSPVTNGLVAQYSGRDFAGTAVAPKRIQDTATFNRSTARTFQTIMETFRKNTNANSKFVFDEVNNGVMLAHIEEAA